jgi:Na+/H+ antiporter NhaD/arsenite permease-like protein
MEELVLPSMIHTCALVHQVIAVQNVKSIQMNVIQIRAKTEEHALKHRTGLFKQLACIIANVLLVIVEQIVKLPNHVTQIPV